LRILGDRNPKLSLRAYLLGVQNLANSNRRRGLASLRLRQARLAVFYFLLIKKNNKMIVTTDTMSPAVLKYYSRGLLATPQASFIHTLAANQRTMPKNSGKYLRMKRYDALSTAMVPLGNTGVTPPSSNLVANYLDVEVQFYGQWLEINEQCQLTSQDDVLNAATIRLGVSMRETEDQLTRDILAAGATALNAVAGVNGDVPTELTESDFSAVTTTLRNQNARTITDNILGENRFGTAPVRDAFLGLTSTKAITDLNAMNNFINKNNYGNANMGLPAEEGSIGNVRVLVSSKGHYASNASLLGANVYSCFIVGRDAYTIVKQDGYTSSFLYGAPVAPLYLNATIGWKMAYAGRVTNDEFIANLKFTLR